MKSRQPPAHPCRSGAGPRRGDADYEDAEIDEVESLPWDAEHDEEERDPDPERYAASSEHAQERSGRQADSRPPRARIDQGHPR